MLDLFNRIKSGCKVSRITYEQRYEDERIYIGNVFGDNYIEITKNSFMCVIGKNHLQIINKNINYVYHLEKNSLWISYEEEEDFDEFCEKIFRKSTTIFQYRISLDVF